MDIKLKIFIGLIGLIGLVGSIAKAATNIDPIERYAWNDVIGWLDFYGTDTVIVKGNKILGYASSSVGYVSFDCETGPTGSNCFIPYSVVNDYAGNLSGWAWSENIGWISFSCSNDHDPILAGIQSVCGVSNYGVTIIADGSGSYFHGFAWNDVVGWISFNCQNISSSCSSSNYKVKTFAGSSSQVGQLTSSIFDGGSIDGVTLNSLMWRGSSGGSGTVVEFQIASANGIGGPWNFIGPDQTSGTYYRPIGPGISHEIRGHFNKRFFRYKVFLKSDTYHTNSPVVEDVIINYSS